MWEYKRSDIKYKTSSEVDVVLAKLGEDGWEIITYDDVKNEGLGTRGGIVHIVSKREKLVVENKKQVL